MDINTENLKTELVAEINQAADMKALEELRVAILGKKGNCYGQKFEYS